MGLSIEEKNNNEAWKAYMEEAQKLKDEAVQRASAIEEKYKNGLQHVGMDGNLELEERREITHWFGQEVKRLRKKYGIEG